METNLKIESIKNELPKMGLVDRFFYLVFHLYQEYFSNYDKYFQNWEGEHEWIYEDEKWILRQQDKYYKYWLEGLYLYDNFLEDFGNTEMKTYILSEINLLTPILGKNFYFQLSYLHKKNLSNNYYLSSSPDFLLIAPFFFSTREMKLAYIHELAISEVEDRKYLIKKYEAAIEEIKYRLNSDIVWNAGFEFERYEMHPGILFPERDVSSLDNLYSYLKELAETPLNKISFTENTKTEEKEKLVLIGMHPEILVKLFSQILKKEETLLIRNFVSHSFNFNFKKYSFYKDITKDVLVLNSKEDTIVICKTILLLTALNFIQPEGASLIKRVLINALKKQKKNTRVWLSDDLRKYISEWMELSVSDLVKDIGFSSKDEFLKCIKD